LNFHQRDCLSLLFQIEFVHNFSEEDFLAAQRVSLSVQNEYLFSKQKAQNESTFYFLGSASSANLN